MFLNFGCDGLLRGEDVGEIGFSRPDVKGRDKPFEVERCPLVITGEGSVIALEPKLPDFRLLRLGVEPWRSQLPVVETADLRTAAITFYDKK
ncbi:hypothetical protein [Nostoc sp. CENA543]|uniref:hypothetical protein n=1 Tax=Nostoc sp. CENA543 TaxID=1869241 RepID=UPI001CEF8007|nr:hypothetical protein [Nostoc sp. CENA543]